MISVNEIRKWLSSPTPLDKIYREYYLKYGKVIDLSKVDEARASLKSPFDDTPCRYMDPAYHENSSPVKMDSLNLVSNSTYFDTNDSISIKKHNNYFPSFKHTHDYVEVCYVISGSCTHSFFHSESSGTVTESITLHDHELVIIPPGMYHIAQTLNDAIVVNFMLKGTALQNIFDGLTKENVPLFNFFSKIITGKHSNTYLKCRLSEDSFVEELLYKMMQEYCNRRTLYHYLMIQMMWLFFSILQRDYGDSMSISVTAPTGTEYIPKFILYIQSHFKDFSMKSMSEHFFLSPSYIARIYKKHTGHTILQTLMDIRVNVASDYLLNTGFTVNDIAEMVGYEDTTYFIRLFKKHTGQTPEQYRKSRSI